MKNVLKATVVSLGLAALATGAMAQFVPNMDAAAVQAQVKQQLTAKATIEAIVTAATKARVLPQHVIDAVLLNTPADQRMDAVAELARLYKDNPAALQVLASAGTRNPQLGLKSDQVAKVLAQNLSVAEFQLAGLDAGAAGLTPTVGPQASVNSLFGANGPAAGSGGGRAASPN